MNTPRLICRAFPAGNVRATKQGGFALMTSLLILIIMTLLALSMFRSVGLQEKIAGNTREKQRSLQAAESALQYGEWWLSQGNGSTGNPAARFTTPTAWPT